MALGLSSTSVRSDAAFMDVCSSADEYACLLFFCRKVQ